MTDTLTQPALLLMDEPQARACVEKIRAGSAELVALLTDLREREGWRALRYRSWTACLDGEFIESRATLYRALQAAKVAEVSQIATGSLPASHLRALVSVPEGEREAVLERAKELASGRKVTAADVKQAAGGLVAAEVRGPELTLPEANGDEPPAGTMRARCRECQREFEQEIGGDAVAARVCARCRARAERGATVESCVDATVESTTPDAAAAPGEGPRRQAHTAAPAPPRQGPPAAPPETTGVISGAETVWVREGTQKGGFVAPGTPPGADLAHGATEGVSRQAARLEEPPSSCPACASPRRWETPPGGGVNACCDACGRVGSHDERKQAMSSDAPGPQQATRPPYADPDDSAPPSDLAYLRAHGIPEGTALRLARRVVELAGDGNPFRAVEEDAEVLRVVREVSAKVDGGLPRLLRVMALPGFLNWMNRHGRKAP